MCVCEGEVVLSVFGGRKKVRERKLFFGFLAFLRLNYERAWPVRQGSNKLLGRDRESEGRSDIDSGGSGAVIAAEIGGENRLCTRAGRHIQDGGRCRGLSGLHGWLGDLLGPWAIGQRRAYAGLVRAQQA